MIFDKLGGAVVYTIMDMVEDAIRQGLMFDVSEEHWESLEKCDGMLATREVIP